MHDSKPTHRFRISLRTLLLSVPIFAIGIVIWQSNAELESLRAEVRKLRDETGQLTIDDPERIHAIQIVTDYPLAWKWRVYIPEGRKVRIANYNHQISKEGLPEANNGLLLVGPNEFVVTVKLDRQPDGRWRSGVSCDGQTTYRVFPDDATTWLDKGESGSQSRQVHRGVFVEKVGESPVLLRKRVFYDRGNIPPVNEPAETDGLLVWLAE